jgi:lysophospholipase L1-like esterase
MDVLFGVGKMKWGDWVALVAGFRQTPPLMAKDLIHLTVDGYQQSARDFSKSFQLMNLNR